MDVREFLGGSSAGGCADMRETLEIIDQNMRFLEQEKETFKVETASFKDVQAIKHSLLEITEACIDMAIHIIALEGVPRPSTYSQLFHKLAEHNIIPTELGNRLGEMAKFRNVLVHRYNKVKLENIQEIVETDLQQVKQFVGRIYDYMAKTKE